MANHSLSALISLFITILLIALGQTFKSTLAASRQGTLLTGGLSALVFVFTLTAISNLKMAMTPHSKSGLFEVGIGLVVAVITAASIHRIAITMCLLFSGVLLFFVNSISQGRYSAAAQTAQQSVASKKKK
uniref:Dolichyl-diphosphooligosaccharide--protein glycosyltransferase subunit KCP2 n=1 Tax=Acrobeloides nanus TaxID=290746 RepID=A0A914C6F3_9BILA